LTFIIISTAVLYIVVIICGVGSIRNITLSRTGRNSV